MNNCPGCDYFKDDVRRSICSGKRQAPQKLVDSLRDQVLKECTRRGVLPADGEWWKSSQFVAMSGPGSEFKALAQSLRIPTPAGCDCEAVRREMDDLGVEGCRRERERLLSIIRGNAAKVSWIAKLCAVGPAITSGLAFRINPLDPLGSLFDEAVSRAERKARQKSQPEYGGCDFSAWSNEFTAIGLADDNGGERCHWEGKIRRRGSSNVYRGDFQTKAGGKIAVSLDFDSQTLTVDGPGTLRRAATFNPHAVWCYPVEVRVPLELPAGATDADTVLILE